MRIRILTIIFAALLLSVIPFQKASAGLIPVYRFSCFWWFWTTNYDYGNAYCQGQHYDGIAFYAWDNGQTGTEQVYRLFNINYTGDFVMDLDAAKNRLDLNRGLTWVDQNPTICTAWYDSCNDGGCGPACLSDAQVSNPNFSAFRSQIAGTGTAPIYQFNAHGNHFYSTSSEGTDFPLGGVAFYACTDTASCSNHCEASTCTTSQCWNGYNYVSGTKACVDNGCAANTCVGQTCNNSIAVVNGTKTINECTKPAGFGYTCSSDGKTLTLNWNATTGASFYYLRVDDTSDGLWYNPAKDTSLDQYTSTSFSRTITPGVNYSAWIHSGSGSNSSPPASLTNIQCSCTPSYTYTCSHSNNLNCSLASNCGKTNVQTASCLGLNSCTGSTENKALSSCTACADSTVSCPSCSAAGGFIEVSP